jgi:hypothetical protein
MITTTGQAFGRERVVGDPKNGNSYTTIKAINSILNPVVIQQVGFQGSGTNPLYYHELKNDDENVTYSPPQWKDADEDGSPTGAAGDHNYPFGFTSKSKPTISARFKIENLKDQNLSVKATSPQGVTLPATLLSILPGGIYKFDLTEAVTGFAPATGTDPMADYYDAKDSSAFQLDWYVMLPYQNVWNKVGSTKHTVCITKGDPVATLDSRQETLFVVACRNAKGKTATADITSGIWSDFTDREILKADGVTKLAYYKEFNNHFFDTKGLISNNDGQCAAWVHFFVDLNKVHGIDYSSNVKEITPVDPNVTGFMVQDWSFAAPGHSHDPLLKYLNLAKVVLIGTNKYNWDYSESDYGTGIQGQGKDIEGGGTGRPASLFVRHYVLDLGGTAGFYDPSYGVRCTISQFDAKLSGVYAIRASPVDEPIVGMDMNLDGDMTDMGVISAGSYLLGPASAVLDPSGLRVKSTATSNY